MHIIKVGATVDGLSNERQCLQDSQLLIFHNENLPHHKRHGQLYVQMRGLRWLLTSISAYGEYDNRGPTECLLCRAVCPLRIFNVASADLRESCFKPIRSLGVGGSRQNLYLSNSDSDTNFQRKRPRNNSNPFIFRTTPKLPNHQRRDESVSTEIS